MNILIDENMTSQRLATRLRAAGHDVVTGDDAGLISASDPRPDLGGRPGSARTHADHEDFTDLHGLVLACGGDHPGLLIVRFDADPRHNLTERGIVTPVSNLESSGVAIPSQIHVINHWR